MPKIFENEPRVRQEEPAYTINSNGNVIVNLDRLLNDPRSQKVVDQARAIVREQKKSLHGQ